MSGTSVIAMIISKLNFLKNEQKIEIELKNKKNKNVTGTLNKQNDFFFTFLNSCNKSPSKRFVRVSTASA